MVMVRSGSVRVAVVGGGSSGVAPRSRPAVSVRVLVCAALLALLAGGAVVVGVRAGHSGAMAGHPRASRQGLWSLPLALRGLASATLGAGERGYGASAAAAGFAMHNPGQRLSARFDSSGVQVGSGAVHVKLSLQGVGYGSALRALPEVAPHARGNRISYGYPGVSAWYVNGPLGLEQGFTVARPRDRDVSGPLTLALGIGERVPVSLGREGHSARFGRARGAALRYSGLSATDARGHVLPSWLEVNRGRLLLRVEARGVAYPLRIDPFVQSQEKLTGGSEEVRKGEFGYSVAISADGSTALIGAPADNRDAGAVWVFTNSGSGWTQQGPKLTGAEETREGDFGSSVALSADGNTALIGGLRDKNFSGAAWVFSRSESTWTQQGPKLTGGSEAENLESLGDSVALSGDGNTALIGARGGEGAALVFTRSGSTWARQGPKLTGSETVRENNFGASVALSADGNTALVGGTENNREAGVAWVFTRSGSTWTQQGPALSSAGEPIEGTLAGIHSVALSGDGDAALVSGISEKSGAVWTFTRSGSTWTQQGSKFTGSEETAQSEFGQSVALSAEGNTALIGGFGDNDEAGAAWVFNRTDSGWTQQGPKLTGGSEEVSADGRFGSSVALASENDIALIGAPVDHIKHGGVWAFENTTTPRPEVTSVAPKLGRTTGGTTVTITGSNFAEASGAFFGSLKAASFTVNSPTSITAVSPEEPVGKVDITVRTPMGGLSLRTSHDLYEFKPPITALSPNTGSSAGGTSVTVTGTGFGLGSTATVFKFGSTPATSVNCASSTECTLLTPAHTAGTVTVKATVNKVTSQVTKADHFTYE